MKKSLIAILMTTVFLISTCGPLFYNMTEASYSITDTSYQTIKGNLATDTYSLYPYSQTSLTLGLSQYGELIDNATNIGLQYGNDTSGRDPFAPPPGSGLDTNVPPKVPKNVWINGWYIDLTYNNTLWGLRTVWAGALFADLASYAGPWLKVSGEIGGYNDSYETFLKPGYAIDSTGKVVGTTPMNGGRKTNGTAYTDPITVLYDGPREYVALLVNHISDVDETTGTAVPLVEVMFTVIFNKVSKEVTVLKDVKMIQQAKFMINPLWLTVPVLNETKGSIQPQQQEYIWESFSVPYGVLVQFSNREEWDLGSPTGTSSFTSYAHFYTAGAGEGQSTVYDRYYTALPTLPTNVSVINGYSNMENTSVYGPAPSQWGGDDTYDVAQIISNDFKYVGFAAYWPSLSDWSIDAGRANQWYRTMTAADVHYADSMTGTEPWKSPLTIGEWDFMLTDSDDVGAYGPVDNASILSSNVEFRGVTVYGVTNLHDGDDYNIPYSVGSMDHYNVIDKEVRYLIDEVYNPWDLYQALDKCTSRWVQMETGDGTTANFTLTYSYEFPDRPWTDGYPYVEANDFIGSQSWYNGTDYYLTWTPWDSYNYYSAYVYKHSNGIVYDPSAYITDGASFAERVLVNGTLQVRDKDYILWTNASQAGSGPNMYYGDNGYVWVNFTKPPGPDATIEILFSTYGSMWNDGSWEWGTVGRDSLPIDSEGLSAITQYTGNLAYEYDEWDEAPVWNPGSDMQDTMNPAAPFVLAQQRPSLLPNRNAYMNVNATLNDGRVAFQNYWCCHVDPVTDVMDNGVPIASSNIIAAGGPSANLVSQYFNDYLPVLDTLPNGGWTPNAANNQYKLMPLTCWSLNKTTYDSYGNPVTHAYVAQFDSNGTQTIGYGVIGTYKDINGTVGLVVWGYTGQDTYYTSWALLHSDVLYATLDELPRGVTSLILKFNYTLHPTDYCFVTVMEALGTISEYDYQAFWGVGALVPTLAKPLIWDPAAEFDWPVWPTWVTDKFPTIHVDP